MAKYIMESTLCIGSQPKGSADAVDERADNPVLLNCLREEPHGPLTPEQQVSEKAAGALRLLCPAHPGKERRELGLAVCRSRGGRRLVLRPWLAPGPEIEHVADCVCMSGSRRGDDLPSEPPMAPPHAVND